MEQPKAETAPKVKYEGMFRGIPMYSNPHISPGIVLLRDADDEILGYIYNVAKIELGR